MSKVYKCDGCGYIHPGSPREVPRTWHVADIKPGDKTAGISGDFCSLDCLAKHLATGRLAQVIQQAGL